MGLELYYFSFTGTSRAIGNVLAERLQVLPKEILAPRYSYTLWLLLSFLPNVGVRISYPRPEGRQGIFIFPKWTFNCPPATSFLREVSFEKLLLVIVYGGWRERPYGEHYKALARKNSKEVELHFVKRRSWRENQEEVLEDLVQKVIYFFGEEILQ